MQNDPSRAGNAPCKNDAHIFHDKQDQPVGGVAPSADGLGLCAGHNPVARGSPVAGKQPCPSKQAPQPYPACPSPALPAVTPQFCKEVDMEVVDLAEFDESDEDVSEATALAQVRGLCLFWWYDIASCIMQRDSCSCEDVPPRCCACSVGWWFPTAAQS